MQASRDAARNLRRGAMYMVGSSLLFAGMGVAVKYAAAALSNETIVFFRSAAGLVAILPLALHRGLPALRTEHLGLHAVRGLAGLAAMYCFFFAIAHLPLAEAVLFNYATPLFVPFIAFVWLRERFAARLWVFIGVGFVGIALILKPTPATFNPVSLIGLSAGLFAAFAMVTIRRLTRTEPSFRIVFYFGVVATIVSAVPLAWAWRTPPTTLWAVLMAMGVLGTGAQLLLTRAYALAPAAMVGPFTYTTVVFAALFGAVLWQEQLDIMAVLGIGLVCAGGVLVLRYAPLPRPIAAALTSE